jgi:hypothetical protein
VKEIERISLERPRAVQHHWCHLQACVLPQQANTDFGAQRHRSDVADIKGKAWSAGVRVAGRNQDGFVSTRTPQAATSSRKPLAGSRHLNRPREARPRAVETPAEVHAAEKFAKVPASGGDNVDIRVDHKRRAARQMLIRH